MALLAGRWAAFAVLVAVSASAGTAATLAVSVRVGCGVRHVVLLSVGADRRGTSVGWRAEDACPGPLPVWPCAGVRRLFGAGESQSAAKLEGRSPRNPDGVFPGPVGLAATPGWGSCAAGRLGETTGKARRDLDSGSETGLSLRERRGGSIAPGRPDRHGQRRVFRSGSAAAGLPIHPRRAGGCGSSCRIRGRSGGGRGRPRRLP